MAKVVVIGMGVTMGMGMAIDEDGKVNGDDDGS